ncbi:MAG TPA: uroporphyrinogen decarboxylase family protein [Dehalococcoidia bacterium]|nr:uroporphyrinogen decarboxylase family protein [Dehalococcoidia bacterium]
MAEAMSKRERVMAALHHQEVDRPPVSMWRHFYEMETSPGGLSEAMLGFQRRFQWDFMKVNPRASYHCEDWGVRLAYTKGPDQSPATADWPVKRPSDWRKVEPLDIRQGALGDHLKALDLIRKGLKKDVPFVMTVFTPLSIAGGLTESPEAMLRFMTQSPEAVHQALKVITDTFIRFGRECLEMGADGLFYATTAWATYDRLTDAQYNEFGRPYDLKLLAALPPASFHILHVCRGSNMLTPLAGYPVQAFNWDAAHPANSPLSRGRELLGKTVIGGVDHQGVLLKGTPSEVMAHVNTLREQMPGTGWMMGPGCTFSPEVPEANLAALREGARAS